MNIEGVAAFWAVFVFLGACSAGEVTCLTGNGQPSGRIKGTFDIFKPGQANPGYPVKDSPNNSKQSFESSKLTDGNDNTFYEWPDGEFGRYGRDIEVDLGKTYFVTRIEVRCNGKRLHNGRLYVKPIGKSRLMPVRYFDNDDYVDVEKGWRKRTRIIRFDKLNLVVRNFRMRIEGSHQPRFSELQIWGREATKDDSREVKPLLVYDQEDLGKAEIIEQIPAPDAGKPPIFGDGPRFRFRGLRQVPPSKSDNEFNQRLLRVLANLKYNYVIHEGLDWAVKLNAWKTAYGGAIDVGDLMAAIRFNKSLGMETIGGWAIAPSQWVLQTRDPSRVEARPGEAFVDGRSIKFKSYPGEALYRLRRVNCCPLNPANFETFKNVVAELCDIYPSEYFFASVDEPLQWYNGARWACCPRCKGKDPVKLMANWVNKCSDVVRKEHKRIHMYQTTILLKEHQGEEAGWPGGPKIKMYEIMRQMPKERTALVNWSYGPWKKTRAEKDSSGLNKHLASQGFEKIIQNVGYADSSFEIGKHVKWAGKDGADFVGGMVANYGGRTLADMARGFKFLDYVVNGMYLWNPGVGDIGSRPLARRILEGVEMFRQELEGTKLPSRSAKPNEFFFINLSRRFNRSTVDDHPYDGKGWVDLGEGMDLRTFPTGKHNLCGIPFSLSKPDKRGGASCVMLHAKGDVEKTLPDKIKGISVGRKAASLIFLHTLPDALEKRATQAAFAYKVSFKGGLKVEFPVRYRIEVMEWLDQTTEGPADLRIGWFLYGARPAWLGATRSGRRCIVYAAEWVNPYPQFEIDSIEFLIPDSSSSRGAALFGVTGVSPTAEMIEDSLKVGGNDGEKIFTGRDKPINLFKDEREANGPEGSMNLLLPVKKVEPGERVFLAVTINDWDNPGEGEIFLNNKKLEIKPSGRYNGIDHTFEMEILPADLKFGLTPNILRAVWKSSGGFSIDRAALIIRTAK